MRGVKAVVLTPRPPGISYLVNDPQDSSQLPVGPAPGVPEPDERRLRQERRLARFRLWVMLGTGVIVAAAFIFVLSIRLPKPAVDSAEPAVDTAAARSEAAAQPEGASGRTTPARLAPADEARAVFALVESTVARGRERWSRAMLILARSPTGDSTEAGGPVFDARRAAVLGESTLAAARALDSGAAVLDRLAREAPTGSSYRLRAAKAAAEAYVRGLGEDAVFRLEFLRATLAGREALAAGDSAEAEVKANVATSYLRRSELKQRPLERQRDALVSAMRSLGSAR